MILFDQESIFKDRSIFYSSNKETVTPLYKIFN